MIMEGCTAPELTLCPPSDGKVLLHSCCAPCSSAILEAMVRGGMDVTVFFSNSNITPKEEYDRRKAELVRYCASLGVEWTDDDFDHEDWLEKVARGREDAPERGARCLECFRYRLLRSARYAVRNGFSLLTTTLASSRWKSLEQVDMAGSEAVRTACEEYPEGSLVWWGMNWRKGGLQPRRNYLTRSLGFYNQEFCGCEFSRRDRPSPEAAPGQVPLQSNKP